MAKPNRIIYDAVDGEDLDEFVEVVKSNIQHIDARASYKEEERTAVHKAIILGKQSFVEKLFELGSRSMNLADSHGSYPIHLAAIHGRVGIAQLLVRLGGRKIVDEYTGPVMEKGAGNTPLHLAAWNGRADVIEELVLLGSKAFRDRNRAGETPIWRAARKGHPAAIEVLIRYGGMRQLDEADRDAECIPLLVATQHGHTSVVEVLAKMGGGVDRVDRNRNLALHYAANHENDALMVEMLVQFDVNTIDAVNKDGTTPLINAAFTCSWGAIATLVRLGSRAIDQPMKDGCTPLFAAASQRNRRFFWIDHKYPDIAASMRCIKLLLALGANPNVTRPLGLELDPDLVKVIETPLSEEEVAEDRFRVFFSLSLTQQLLSVLIYSRNPMHNSVHRRVLA